MGALVTVPVYFIGRELLDRKAGLMAAALIAILPGHFMWRSQLGFVDHHIAEVLFSTLTVMFLLLALRPMRNDPPPQWFTAQGWKALRGIVVYSLLAGLALGSYLLSWIGGIFFLFIIIVFILVQYNINLWKKKSNDHLCLSSALCFVTALGMVTLFSLWYQIGTLQVFSLAAGILIVLALWALCYYMPTTRRNWGYYFLAQIGLAGLGLGALHLYDPSRLGTIWDNFSVFRPAGGMLTVGEVRGLSLWGWSSMAWERFTTGFYLSLASLAVLLYLVIKQGAVAKTLLLVWSLIMVLAALGQNRFSYYLAVNVALLTSFLCWKVLRVGKLGQLWAASGGVEEAGGSEGAGGKQVKRKTGKRIARAFSTNKRFAFMALSLLAVFFLAFYPNIGKAIDVSRADTGPPPDWHDALVWLKENSPEPFADPTFPYQLYHRPGQGEAFDYPSSAYGVLSWWDYGYWITYIAQRIPNANPTQAGAVAAAWFFLAPDEATAGQMTSILGPKYIVIDYEMARGKFHAMALWAGARESDFFDVYYERTQTGEWRPLLLYHPAYYRSMVSRLYNFSAEAWDPDSWLQASPKDRIHAISHVERKDAKGNKFNAISDVRQFTSYEAAEKWLEANEEYRIMGTNAFISPIPLEKLEHYRLVYRSPTTVVKRGEEILSYVAIFEYQ
jgi:dolichyl-diphosphooligosaccharide--protein glycosyltransferase